MICIIYIIYIRHIRSIFRIIHIIYLISIIYIVCIIYGVPMCRCMCMCLCVDVSLYHHFLDCFLLIRGGWWRQNVQPMRGNQGRRKKFQRLRVCCSHEFGQVAHHRMVARNGEFAFLLAGSVIFSTIFFERINTLSQDAEIKCLHLWRAGLEFSE